MVSITSATRTRVVSARRLLSGNFQHAARQFAGQVEKIGPQQASGWVFALHRPNSSLVVTLMLGGVPIAVSPNGMERADVAEACAAIGSVGDPGFEMRIEPGHVAQALDQASGGLLWLEMVLRTGEDLHVMPLRIRPRSRAGWRRFFDLPKETGSVPALIEPSFQGHHCAEFSDIAAAVPEALAREVLASPMFNPAYYAARVGSLWFGRDFDPGDPLAAARHFCAIGSAFNLVPRGQIQFDPLYYQARRGPGDGTPPLLRFVRDWGRQTPVFPSALAEQAAKELSAPPAGRSAEEHWAILSGTLSATPASTQVAAARAPAATPASPVEISPEIGDMSILDVLRLEMRPLTPGTIKTLVDKLRTLGGFDVNYYLENNPDVARSGMDPLYHYIAHGEREGRRPAPGFDPAYYITVQSDVRLAAPSAFVHYMEFGRHENRRTQKPASLTDRQTAGRPILFVGHSGIRAGAERVLLEQVKWTFQHTARPIVIYLMQHGPLAAEFEAYGMTYVAAETEAVDTALRRNLMAEDWEYVYLNTAVAGGFFDNLPEAVLERHRFVGHIHELAQVLKEHETSARTLLDRADYVISASPDSTAVLADTYGVPADKLETVEAFITPLDGVAEDAARYRAEARRELGLPEAARVIMGCGSVYPRKGPDIFLETALRMLGTAQAPLHFVWVGAGPDRDELVAQVRKEGLEEQILFPGESAEASRLLAAGDLFFLSSREDPFPLVVLEAAQHAIPSVYIAGNTGIGAFCGPAAGYAADSEDPDILAATLTAILDDPETLSRRGTAARDRVLSRFTSARQCHRIHHGIARVLGIPPLVSVVVPNYNHAAYLTERLESIRSQTLQDFELIVLDDCSTDNSVEVISDIIAEMPNAVFLPNTENSGHVFRQWQKGIEQARGSLVWVAESDDHCAPDFLARLAVFFADPSVVIASGRTVPFTRKGPDPAPMEAYLDSQCPGLFDKPFCLEGDRFVDLGMGAACLLVNASGLLFRADALRPALPVGLDYSMAGDWAIYLTMLRRGRIAYDPDARNDFRRHPESRVHQVEGTAAYFEERRKIAALVFQLFAVSRSLQGRIIRTLRHEVTRFAHKSPDIRVEDLLPKRAAPTHKAGPRIALYVHGMLFSKGGIERLAAQLANHLATRGYEVHILCRHWGTRDPVFNLHHAVRLTPVYDEDHEDRSMDAVQAYLVRHGIDVFIPMLSEWLFAPLIEAGVRAGVRIIASEHNDPWKIEELWWSHEARVESFSKVDCIHLLSKAFIPSLPDGLHDRVVTIPNGVDPARFGAQAAAEGRDKVILAVGRLAPQKRLDLLIEAFARTDLADQGWQVHIYGEGAERDALAAQIGEMGLEGAVLLRGLSSDMPGIYGTAAFTVLSSDFEGFGLVVVESFAAATPVIAFADCNGPNEIIRDGRDGKLVDPGPDRISALAQALAAMAGDPEKRMRQGQSARKRAAQFSLSRFEARWETCIQATLKKTTD